MQIWVKILLLIIMIPTYWAGAELILSAFLKESLVSGLIMMTTPFAGMVIWDEISKWKREQEDHSQ